LKFPLVDTPDKEYVSVFGPRFSHTGTRFKIDNRGLAGAVTRLTCAREVSLTNGEIDISLHVELMENQFKYYGKHKMYHEFCIQISREHIREFGFVDNTEKRLNWVLETHPKKELRKSTHTQLGLRGSLGPGPWGKRVMYKCKAGETLASGKYLRAVGDMGAQQTERAAHLMSGLKKACAIPFLVEGSKYIFIGKPQDSRLIDMFKEIVYANDVTLVCFSDDSMVGVNTPEGNVFLNADISSCDGSNYDPVFNMLKRIMLMCSMNTADINGLMDQTLQKCTICSIEKKKVKPYVVTLYPKYNTLYSGLSCTTMINNLANLGIFFEILQVMPRYELRTRSNVQQAIMLGARRAGFILKCDLCNVIEDLQFLKYSPTLDGGVWKVFINLGVILRNFGFCEGDLPGQGDIRLRAAMYISDVLKSYVHGGNHSIMQAFRTKIINGETPSTLKTRYLDANFVEHDISDLALCRRYKISISDVQRVAFIVQQSRLCHAYSDPVFDAIMAKDYGYASTTPVKHPQPPLNFNV